MSTIEWLVENANDGFVDAHIARIRQFQQALRLASAEYAAVVAERDALKVRNGELERALQSALDDVCGANLCSVNSMSSREEMQRLMQRAATTLRAALTPSPQSNQEEA